MADGFTMLPIVGSAMQKDTAIIPDNNQVLNDYWQFAENKYRNKLFDYQKDQKEIQDRLAALDFTTEGTWEVDLPEVNKKVDELVSFIYENPDAITPSASNMDKYLEYQKKKNDIEFSVNKSKTDKALHSEWLKKIADKPEYAKPQNLTLLEQFKGGGLERTFSGLDVTPDYNLFSVQEDILKRAGQVTDETDFKSKGFGLVGSKETVSYDPDGIARGMQFAWNTNHKGTRDEFEGLFNDLPPDKQQQFGSAKKLFEETFLANTPLTISEKNNVRAINYPPSSGDKKPTEEEISARKEMIYRIQNKDAGALDILRGLRYNGVPVKEVKYKESNIPNTPTTITIELQPQNELDGEARGKTVELEVSENTGGAFLSINQFLNSLEGQPDISVEEMSKIPEYKKTGITNQLKPKTADDYLKQYAE